MMVIHWPRRILRTAAITLLSSAGDEANLTDFADYADCRGGGVLAAQAQRGREEEIPGDAMGRACWVPGTPYVPHSPLPSASSAASANSSDFARIQSTTASSSSSVSLFFSGASVLSKYAGISSLLSG